MLAYSLTLSAGSPAWPCCCRMYRCSGNWARFASASATAQRSPLTAVASRTSFSRSTGCRRLNFSTSSSDESFSPRSLFASLATTGATSLASCVEVISPEPNVPSLSESSNETQFVLPRTCTVEKRSFEGLNHSSAILFSLTLQRFLGLARPSAVHYLRPTHRWFPVRISDLRGRPRMPIPQLGQSPVIPTEVEGSDLPTRIFRKCSPADTD